MGTKKHNIPMCVALLLLLLTLVTTHITGGLFARYAVTQGGADSARVAKFQVLAAPSQDLLTVDCATDTDGVYHFTVTNHSEVAAGYSVTVKFKKPIPGTMLQVALDNGQYGYLDQDNAITFPVDRVLNPLDDSQTHQLHFRVTPKEFFGSVQGEDSVELALDFTVTVHARQIR